MNRHEYEIMMKAIINISIYLSLQENETLRNMLKDKEDNAEVIAQMDQFESKT